MYKRRYFIILLMAVAFQMPSLAQYEQYDPCDVVDVAMRKVDERMADGNLQGALDMLKKIQADPKVQDCDQMKVVNYKIKLVEEEIARQNKNSNANSGGSAKSYLSCPDGNHPHMIDLGLPSGTKWACCNVGASKPDAYGDYYAWGETQTKRTYDWKTYIHCNGTKEPCRNIGGDIAGTQYDVAHVKWGGSWVMPSRAQQDELRNNCTSEWTTVNGVNGCKFNGKNGGSVFLPAAGYRWDADLIDAGLDGYYWLSMQSPSYSDRAYYLYFNSGYSAWYYNYRSSGRSVRPVSR